ncbi:MAG: hypothetical protein GXP01_01875 [Alphaproteobacteria bacterium]|nr:hypothetical protein [Alphaproteobacteria bacterium]
MDKIVWVILLVSGGLAAYLFVFSGPEQPQVFEQINGRVTSVVDGDSLYIAGHRPQIRLWGVDAPERAEPGYQAATDTLTALAFGKPLTCQRVDIDRYNRTVARCFLEDRREINRAMIESGTAVEYTRFTDGFYSKN